VPGYGDWQLDNPTYFVIHRGCLSILCRRTNCTVRDLWESMYAPGADYLRYGENTNKLMYCIDYYDMDGRNNQTFDYAVVTQTSSEDNPGCVVRSYDMESMDDTKWLLARPTVFPVVLPLVTPGIISSRDNSSVCLQALLIPDILGLILLQVVYPELQDVLEAELKAKGGIVTPPSLNLATRTLFSVMRLNRYFHTAVMNQQELFLRLAWQHGWMLPVSPLDWAAWPNGALVGDDGRLCYQSDKDWRGYLLTFLRKYDCHIKNRWRFHRMHLQFGKGKMQLPAEGVSPWRWSFGELAVLNSLAPPEPWSWEVVTESTAQV
jgi:hypothetical protein